MRAILIPVKDPRRAKQRLAALLTGEERSALAWAMLRDVALAVTGMKEQAAVTVVTAAPEVVTFARAQGWDLLLEQEQESESASVDWASQRLAEGGITRVLRLPGDIPLVTSGDLDELLRIELPGRAAVIVPSGSGTGTNALLRTPPTAFPSRFGPDSCRLHTEEAGRTGTRLITVTNRRIALDIDEPNDLRSLIALEPAGFTGELLQSWKIGNRFSYVS